MGPGISDLLRKFQFLVLASSYQYWSPLGQEGRQPDWLPVLLNLFCVYLQSKCLFIHLFSLSFLLLVKKWRVVYLAPLIIIGQSQVNYHRIELGVSSFLPAVKQGHLSRLHLFCCFCCQSLSVSDSLRPHGLQPTRLFCLWDFPETRKLEWVAFPFSKGSSQPRY